MAQVHYTSINQKVDCPEPAATLLDISLKNKIPHLHECGGNGRCTTCRVRVLDGQQHLSPRSALERKTAHDRKWDPSIRLACQCRVIGDVQIQRLIWTSAEINKLQLEKVPEGKAEERHLAILCCDLRDFTRITSRNLAFDMAHMLNRFYTMLGDPILMNNGIIYQYVGDEIIGLFGTAGGSAQQNCLDAVRAALGMRYAIERLNRFEMQEFDAHFRIGIGIHHGQAFVGHLGHPKHRQFTVVGDPINVASRIQGCTKELQTPMLLSATVVKQLPAETVDIGRSFRSQLAGKDEPFVLYELCGFLKPDIALALQSSLDLILKEEERFSARFYEKIFEQAPAVRSLFSSNMMAQGRVLTHMLGGIVYSLSRLQSLVMGLRMLGKRHQAYGVRPEHYPLVQQTLLETIREELGEAYTPALGQAWEHALSFVCSEMLKGQSEFHPQHQPVSPADP